MYAGLFAMNLVLTCFYLVSSWFYWVLLSFTWFYWVLLGFTGLYWVLLGYTGLYWDEGCYTWFNRVFTDFFHVLCKEKGICKQKDEPEPPSVCVCGEFVAALGAHGSESIRNPSVSENEAAVAMEGGGGCGGVPAVDRIACIRISGRRRFSDGR